MLRCVIRYGERQEIVDRTVRLPVRQEECADDLFWGNLFHAARLRGMKSDLIWS